MTSGLQEQLNASVCVLYQYNCTVILLLIPIICIQFYVLLQGHFNQLM